MLFSRCLLLATVVFSISNTAFCVDVADSTKPEVTIVQERLFDRKNEIGFSIGHLPDDNFYEVFPVSFNYIHHFSENYAWEVIRASYMLNNERDIKRDLEENFGVTPSTFDEITSHFETSFMIKPSYGKDSVWNRHVVNNETYVSFGTGIATYKKKLSYGDSEQESALTLSAGVGRKYFINKSFNISLDLKDIFIFKENSVESSIYLGVGFNYRFDGFGSFNKTEGEDSSIYNYLK